MQATDSRPIEEIAWNELFEYAPDPYLVTNAAGVVDVANRSAHAMLSAELGSLAGKSLIDFVVEDQQAQARSFVDAVTPHPDVGEIVTRFTSPRGEVEAVARASVRPDSSQISWSIHCVDRSYWTQQRLLRIEHGMEAVRELVYVHGFLSEGRTFQQVAADITAIADRILPSSSCVVSVLDPPGKVAKPVLKAASNEMARAIGQAMLDSGSGPLFDALHSGEAVSSLDVANDSRWPKALVPAVSVLSLPLQGSESLFGTICLYGPKGEQQEIDPELGLLMARQAATMLDNVAAYQSSRDKSQHLQVAMQTRAQIEQAKGMLMMLKQLSAEEAFNVLKEASQQQNRKLNEIAAEVVESKGHSLP